MSTIVSETLRPDLEPLPFRMRSLQIARGYPVPWFVAWVNGEPEFRAADAQKFKIAVREKRCWVCGEMLGRNMTFVLGPMCGITRTTAEPPCHHECASYSAKKCPFLSKPQMVRREDEAFQATVRENQGGYSGEMIRRNPGVTLLWTTRRYDTFGDGRGGVLLKVGDPERIEWYALGKPATREAVLHSIETGLPALEALTEGDTDQLQQLYRLREAFMPFVPA